METSNKKQRPFDNTMKKDKWIWMPHAGHFILGDKCKFHLNTYVGTYIVSTVGELWNDQAIRRITAGIQDKEWYAQNHQLLGDNFDAAYFNKFGYEKLGAWGTYETMVFKARKSKNKCCPYEIIACEDIECERYDDPEKARAGHMKLCKKYAKIDDERLFVPKEKRFK